ncbi:MFS transporter [Pseudomonas sp. NPDC088368]|uniref:MFS transporter n=1 Tax=Pseudomonas sp. NPDC088368 TaxID=3364453 RepID=UPI0037F33BF8
MPLAVLVLTLATFILGTCEFVMMGLLPDIAADLQVSVPKAGWVVTAYALGIAIGGPIMSLVTSRFSRKGSLMALMVLFVIGNLLCVLAASYVSLLAARVVTSLGQGAFFGIGAVMAANLVPEHRKATAIATMFLGLTLATIAGVPIGTALGQWDGWRTPFWAIAGLGVIAVIGLSMLIPANDNDAKPDLRAELRALKDPRIWATLGVTALFTGCAFPLFTFIAPLLRDVTGLTGDGVTRSLFLVGVGMTVGSLLGGKLADWNVNRALILIAVAISVVSLTLRWSSPYWLLSQLNWFLWGVATFAAIPVTQVNVMRFGTGAPNLVSTLNISAFNVGVALGSWAGSLVLSAGYAMVAIPVVAALIAMVAGIAAMLCARFSSSTGCEHP